MFAARILHIHLRMCQNILRNRAPITLILCTSFTLPTIIQLLISKGIAPTKLNIFRTLRNLAWSTPHHQLTQEMSSNKLRVLKLLTPLIVMVTAISRPIAFQFLLTTRILTQTLGLHILIHQPGLHHR